MSATVAQAQDEPSAMASNLAAARRLLETGHSAQAAAVLEGQLLEYAGNPDYDRLFGLALYRSGQTGPAQFAFERVLMALPADADATLMLAQISMERNDRSHADELLQALSGRRLDTRQQQQLEQLLASPLSTAGESEPLSVRGYLQAGAGWDSNVTGGPDKTTLYIPGLGPGVTALGSAAQAGDDVMGVEGGVSMTKLLAPGTWLTAVTSARWGHDRRRADMAESFVNADLGLLQRSGDDFFGVNLTGQDYLLDNKTYRQSSGVIAQWAHPLGASTKLTAYLSHLYFEFPDHSIDNSSRNGLSLAFETQPTDGTLSVQYGLSAGKEKAKDETKPQFTFWFAGAQLGSAWKASETLWLSAGAVFELRRHTAEDPLNFVMRQDHQLSLGLSADYRFRPQWHLLPQVTWSQNRTNTELYTYSRQTVMLTLRRDFENAKP
jgi:hypothetical protein